MEWWYFGGGSVWIVKVGFISLFLTHTHINAPVCSHTLGISLPFFLLGGPSGCSRISAGPEPLPPFLILLLPLSRSFPLSFPYLFQADTRPYPLSPCYLMALCSFSLFFVLSVCVLSVCVCLSVSVCVVSVSVCLSVSVYLSACLSVCLIISGLEPSVYKVPLFS